MFWVERKMGTSTLGMTNISLESQRDQGLGRVLCRNQSCSNTNIDVVWPQENKKILSIVQQEIVSQKKPKGLSRCPELWAALQYLKQSLSNPRLRGEAVSRTWHWTLGQRFGPTATSVENTLSNSHPVISHTEAFCGLKTPVMMSYVEVGSDVKKQPAAQTGSF